MQRFLIFFHKSLRISKKSGNFATDLHPRPFSEGEKGITQKENKTYNDEKNYLFDVHCRDGIVLPATGVQGAGV